MKAEPILQELEAVKERLDAQAGGNTQRFLDQMETWLDEHPHAGPVVNSPEALQTRVRAREATETPPPPNEPYRVYDPIVAEVHRIREQLYREAGDDPQRFFENLRAWSEAHPHSGPVVRNAAELRQLISEEERKRTEVLLEKDTLILREQPKPKG